MFEALFARHQELKATRPATTLLFKSGDFYEIFGDDALYAAHVLELTISHRTVDGQSIPYCGIPEHSAARYIARLFAAGFLCALIDP